MRIPTIPLLPNRIAVGLQSDLVDFVNEIKFLLLFFDKPLAFLSTPEFCFLTDETIHLAKRGQSISTSWLDEDPAAGLKNTEVLQTEEWALIEDNLNIYPMNFITLDGSPKESSTSDDSSVDAFSLLDSIIGNRHKNATPTSRWAERFMSTDSSDDFEQFMLRIILSRLCAIIDACRKEDVPMIWSGKDELGACERFTQQFLTDFCSTADTRNTQIESAIKARIVLGDSLLQQIMQLGIINLSEVSVSDIIEFRKSNSDLLYSFLLHYRHFLSDIEASPNGYIEITRKYTNSVATDFSTINRELESLKRKRNLRWLKFCSSGADSLSKSAIWSFFVTPILSLLNLASEAGKVATEISDDLYLKQEVLQKTSSGYLWEASKKFQNG